jgi:hypothetical protein
MREQMLAATMETLSKTQRPASRNIPMPRKIAKKINHGRYPIQQVSAPAPGV